MENNKKPVVCIICRSSELREIAINMSFGVKINECLGCGFVQSEYVSASAKKDYYSKFYRGALSNDQIERLKKKSHEQAVFQIKYINSIISGNQFTNALDYGAAEGGLAQLLTGMSKSVYVTEADPQYIRLLKEMREIIFLNEADLDSDKFNGFFDFISLSHVLEHITDPLSALERFSKLMKKNGYLFIDIPNELVMLTRANFQAKGHLSYFTIDSFKRLVNTHGKFDIMEIRTCNRTVEEFIASGCKLPEDYSLQSTPNGTVIRSLLINARPDLKFERRLNDFIDEKLLLDEFSRRIVYMTQRMVSLHEQIDDLKRKTKTT